jgi:hypothetical protein
MTSIPIPATQNEAWGFWGTMNEHASAAWPLAMTAISGATGQPLESVRAFLDSRHGRHFSDATATEMATGASLNDAIDAATRRWMAWRINHRTSIESGIPEGLPFLTGLVAHFEILDDMKA